MMLNFQECFLKGGSMEDRFETVDLKTDKRESMNIHIKSLSEDKASCRAKLLNIKPTFPIKTWF